MDVADVLRGINKTQAALKVLAALQLTSFMWPQDAVVQNGSSFDFIIVGAGSAGSAIANRLSEIESATVLLIEAGGDPPIESVVPGLYPLLKNTDSDWNYPTEDDGYSEQFLKNHGAAATRGKMLGGSSSLNFMVYARGSWHDYDNWAKITGDEKWNWDNVLPYFIKSEKLEDPVILRSPDAHFHGTGGNLKITKGHHKEAMAYFQALEEVGNKIVLDTNSKGGMGFTESMFTLADGVRQSTAQSFLIPAKDRPNLFVLKNTLVSKILFDDNKNAIGVKAILNDNTTITFQVNKEIIISGGAVNTPQLLMLSGIGPARHLETLGLNVISDLPVGETLQDHVILLLLHKMGEATPPKPSDPRTFGSILIEGYASLDKNKTYPDYQVFSYIMMDPTAMLTTCSFYFSYLDEICQALYDGVKGHELLLSYVNLVHPESRGKILLRSTDARVRPRIYMGYYSNNIDLDLHIKYVKHFLQVQGTDYFRRVDGKLVVPKICGCDELDTEDEFWRCYVLCMMGPGYHLSGTCPMGTVVDSNLRVNGVQRLRVADASVMPRVTSANTNAPTIMIGEKASDMIKNEYYFKEPC